MHSRDEAFCRALVAAIAAGTEIKTARASCASLPTAAFGRLRAARSTRPALAVAHPSAQSSNTVVVLGDRLFLKAYRRLQDGVNPEVGDRPLSDRRRRASPTAFRWRERSNISPMTARLRRSRCCRATSRTRATAGRTTLNYLERFLEARAGARKRSASVPREPGTAATSRWCARSGMRTGELHAALSRSRGDPAFEPVPIAPADVARLVQARAQRSARDARPAGARARGAARAGARGRTRRCSPRARRSWRASTRTRRDRRRRQAASASTATTIWARCWSCRTTS